MHTYITSGQDQHNLALIIQADCDCSALVERCPHRYSHLASDSRWLRNPDAANWDIIKYNYRIKEQS